MTAVSRFSDYPPSTPIYRRSLRHGAGALTDHTPSDRSNATISDSPLPPAPVSHFLGEDEIDQSVVRDMPLTISHSATEHMRPRAYKYSSMAQDTNPDDDSPGVGRRAASVISSRLDDLDVPRASTLFQDAKPRLPASLSSPFAAATHHVLEESRSKSSPPLRPALVTRVNRHPVSPSRLEDGPAKAPAPIRRRSHEKSGDEDDRKVRYASSVEEHIPVKRSLTEAVEPAAATTSTTGATGYRTPAMAGRTLRSNAATTATAQRSAARSLRKLTRSSNRHPPARRVVRRYSDDEDEELEEVAENEDKENGSPDGHSIASEDHKGKHRSNDDGSSGSGSGSGMDAAERPDPRYLPYGYDAEKARMRAEIMEQASLVRSPSPRHALQSEERAAESQLDALAPPPRRSEAHPSASRAAAPSANPAKSAAAIQNFLASTVAPPVDPLASRRTVAASSTNMPAPLRGAEARAAAPEQLPPTAEQTQEDAARIFNDFRPESIWAEAARQATKPLAGHEEFEKKLLGASKCVRMRDLKFRKPKGGRNVGRGGFSVVHVVRGPVCERVRSGDSQDVVEEVAVPDEQQGYFALKLVDLKEVESDQDKLDLIAEANLLRTLADLEGSEPYLLRYYGHQVTGDAQGNPDKLRILMEVGDNDFSKILQLHAPLPRELIADYFRQMLEAVHFIHNADMVHADLKPANFLNVNDRLKLIDFGISKQIQQGTVHISRDNIIGTPNYMAPESIKTQRSKGKRVYKAGKPSDVWALGCILYQMIWGRPPFDRFPSNRKLDAIVDPNHEITYTPFRDPRYPDTLDVDQDMMDCVKWSLKFNVEDRATIPDLLRHPFLRRPDTQAPEEQEMNPEDEVTLSRATLRKLVGRLRILALQQELTEDNVIERADLLFNNLKQAQI